MPNFVQGTPVDFEELIVSDVVKLLDADGHNYAVVQFIDPDGNYAAAPKRIAVYNREGGVPTQLAVANGFGAGENDQIVFQKEELKAGVRILNADAGLDMTINIQYYKS